MKFKNAEEAQRAVKRAASEQHLNADMLRVCPIIGFDGTVDPELTIHFPGGDGMGTYEQVFAVFKEIRSFTELGSKCLERNLW